ncbi:MCE family protein [Aeromicrobium sp. SMF47]|uniref:MCE family protein n=1 Tax=Aeromicrobium TaxID=2040 RepID=UPI00129DEE56|nr:MULTISPECIES: MCE family protein [Aeromicrobium]MRJ76208.1 MCE family protein [Aeromicrobium yanjiei]MRK00558.1 MCE family protein [Aeromicrobium sp. S22]
MARTPVLERPTSLKVLGTAFLAIVLFFLWITYAFFTKAFVDYDTVTLKADTAGVNLPQNADIKLRGMIVGEVRSVRTDGDGVELELGMNPKLIKDVPKDVTAQLVPKTLFGEKYVALIPPAGVGTGGPSLQAGDTITKADVPIEVETLLNDLYPLLEAVDPANLSYTLSAVSSALEGRGTQLGETLVTLNSYLRKIDPEVPQLITDVTKLGTVADGYADAMPDIGRLLRNTVVTGNTVVAKKAQLAAFFDEGTDLSDTLTAFTTESGEDLVELAGDSRPVLEVVADYSVTFPCFLKSMDTLIPRLDSAYRDGMLHIDVELIKQPNAYAYNNADPDDPDNENLAASKEVFDAARKEPGATSARGINGRNAASPSCIDLNEINKGRAQQEALSSQKNPFKIPADVYRLVGVKRAHSKFGSTGADGDFARNRPAASSLDLQNLVQPSIGATDSAGERAQLDVLIGSMTGTKASEVPDIGSLLVGPLLRGTKVSPK